MLTFVQFIEEIARNEIVLTPCEVQRLVERFGQKTLQMGKLSADGSLRVPMDCVIEAVHSLGDQRINEAVEGLRRSDEMVDALDSVEILIERVTEARRKKVLDLATAVQQAPTQEEAHKYWRQLEHLVFGI